MTNNFPKYGAHLRKINNGMPTPSKCGTLPWGEIGHLSTCSLCTCYTGSVGLSPRRSQYNQNWVNSKEARSTSHAPPSMGRSRHWRRAVH